MEKSINIFKNIDELSGFFAQHLKTKVKAIPEGQFFSIALSGGSTPRAVFQYLALNYKTQIPWKKILVFWGDERCVPPESEESNYRMANESLLDQVPIPGSNIFRIMGEARPSNELERYAKLVRQHITLVNGIPQFNFIMLGLGNDGHTASIFPGNLDFFNSEKLFEVAEHPQTKQKRITATGKLINQALNVAFLVTGESKAEMVNIILGHKEDWQKLPASLVHPKDGELIWLLDDKAAFMLK
ncbi:MAG: 6-phosphogluconolactonase [Bacteroidales bacterium]|nr:6-phosphogluconolactonase [Bacteroidales bacterium]